MTPSIGIDFGTTNCVFSLCSPDGAVRTARFPWPMEASETFRSILCFWQEGVVIQHACAQMAIDEYLKDTQDSRLIQSIKTYLGSESFTETRLFNKRFDLEDLIALLLRDLWRRGTTALDINPDPAAYHIVSGRPVAFAGAAPNESLALARLKESYKRAGINTITFAFEPEGAAFWFAQHHPETACILVADFGGGTSDFSLVEIKNGLIRPLAHSGIGIAGDMLDFRLIDHAITPLLGKNSHYKSFGKKMDMPTGYYRSFASWHLLSLLKTPKIMREIRDILHTSTDPEGLTRLISLIEQEMGYLLYRAVSSTKATLSIQESATFKFETDDIHLTRTITRSQFNKWIANDIYAMRHTLETMLKNESVLPARIDRVFMTGGTSFVPAVRDMIANLFGAEKIADGGEFTSVSAGLALIARARSGKQKDQSASTVLG